MEGTADPVLLLAIVQSEDASSLIDEVNRHGYRATRIDSFGGFLGTGNVVVLIGIESGRVPDVLDAIRETCETRPALLFPTSGDAMIDTMTSPIEVEVGGAVVFALPVERYVRLSGREQRQAAEMSAS